MSFLSPSKNKTLVTHRVRIAATLPSQEGKSEDIGKTEGVGALPGSRDERGVAILPEERHQGLTVNGTHHL